MDFDIGNLFLASVALLLCSTLVTPLFAARRKLAGTLNFLFCLAAGAGFAAISFQVLGGHLPGASFLLRLGGVDIPFLIDGFSAVFLALIALMGATAAFYCIGYMEMDHYRQYSLRGFLACFPIFLAGMAGIVTVDDLSAGFSLAWQMMTLASFFLIRFDHRDASILRSATRYLWLMELAWACVVAGALLVPQSAIGMPLHALADGLGTADEYRRPLIYGLLLLGFGMKAGMFPLGQLWLPDAHSSAPSPISALLSGVMIKTGVYGIVRTLFWMVPPAAAHLEERHLGLILAAFGVVTLFIGTVQALKQHDAKRLHAYSSIGQMGYILLGIGTAHHFLLSGNPALGTLAALALIGSLYHVVNHALFKGLLFLCTGSVQYVTGTKDLDRLGGLLRLMPLTALSAAIAAASVAGIPATSGFMSKWAIISASLLGGKMAGVIVLFGVIALMTSAITLACYVLFFGMCFTASGIEWSGGKPVREVGRIMLIPQFLLATICLIQGLCPGFFFRLFSLVFAGARGSGVQALLNDPDLQASLVGSPAGVSLHAAAGPGVAFVMPLVLLAMLAVAGLFAAWLKRAGGSGHRTAPVWLCGYQLSNDSNRYLSSHIYAAFKKFMKWTGGNARAV